MNARIGPAPDVAAREAKILGDGPRIDPIRVDTLSADLRAIIHRMAEVNLSIESRQTELVTDVLDMHENDASPADIAAALTKLPEIVRTLLHHADLFNLQTDVGIELLIRGTLPPRDRELAILRIGWLCQAPYEWGEHVLLAKRVGLTSADIERVTQGAAAPGWSRHEQAVLSAAEELYADAMISDATWAILTESYDEKQLIELPMVVGQYQTVAYYQNSLRLRLHDGNFGLKAR